MSHTRSRAAALTAVLAVIAVAATAVLVSPASARNAHHGQAKAGADTSQRATSTEMMLKMNGKRTKNRPGVIGLKNSGRSKLRVTVATRDQGRAKLVKGRVDKHAVRLPALDTTSRPPRAVIRVVPSGKHGSPLDPGNRDFVFGAEFRLDKVSDNATRHDGDNLMQRGQFSSKSQYKIQIDGSTAQCRVKGSLNALAVKAEPRLQRNLWYRIRCQRIDNTLQLRVWKLKRTGPAILVRDTGPVEADSGLGGVRLPRTQGLSIGGRLSNKNMIPAGQTDQFNGIVDQVYFNVL